MGADALAMQGTRASADMILTLLTWNIPLSAWERVNLLVQKLSYSRIIKLIPWFLMPWLLASPSHQQPWYWLNRIARSLSSFEKKCLLTQCWGIIENASSCHIFIFSQKLSAPEECKISKSFAAPCCRVLVWFAGEVCLKDIIFMLCIYILSFYICCKPCITSFVVYNV